MPRPTKYNEELIKKFLSFISNGMTAKQACYLVDISEDTLAVWTRNKTDFSDRIEKAKTLYIASLVKEVNAGTKKDHNFAYKILCQRDPENWRNAENKDTKINVNLHNVPFKEIVIELPPESNE